MKEINAYGTIVTLNIDELSEEMKEGRMSAPMSIKMIASNEFSLSFMHKNSKEEREEFFDPLSFSCEGALEPHYDVMDLKLRRRQRRNKFKRNYRKFIEALK